MCILQTEVDEANPVSYESPTYLTYCCVSYLHSLATFCSNAGSSATLDWVDG